MSLYTSYHENPSLLQSMYKRRFYILFGALFGAWLGGVYAFASQAVNWIVLPGIPLASPDGSFSQYLLQYLLMGAVLGLVSSLPASSWMGIVMGGFLGALFSTFIAISQQWGRQDFIRNMIPLLYTFLPLVVLLLPLAYIIRRGVDAQVIDSDRPYLWGRRILIPALLTLIAIFVGSLSLYDTDVRNAFRYSQSMLQTGLQASSADALPHPLQDVKGFRENAHGAYAFSWSDDTEAFFGPRPATGELSQFLIITRFKNGFQFACIFSRTVAVPFCTNY